MFLINIPHKQPRRPTYKWFVYSTDSACSIYFLFIVYLKSVNFLIILLLRLFIMQDFRIDMSCDHELRFTATRGTHSAILLYMFDISTDNILMTNIRKPSFIHKIVGRTFIGTRFTGIVCLFALLRKAIIAIQCTWSQTVKHFVKTYKNKFLFRSRFWKYQRVLRCLLSSLCSRMWLFLVHFLKELFRVQTLSSV